ncbi:hypothetical protein QZH41_006922 [Actinostola sp. cb2023]|nr:hypothetical protein QZH41_006922 [Actinostola sp. cb2023]
MEPLDKQVVIDDDPEISFIGYGINEENPEDDTLPYSDDVLTTPNSPEESPRTPGESLYTLHESFTPSHEDPGRRFRQLVNQMFQSRVYENGENDEIAELDDLEFKVVKRSEILQDVMKLYQDKAICDYRLSVQFVEEVGMDCGGLTEDLFASFWEEAFDKYFDGDVSRQISYEWEPYRTVTLKWLPLVIGRFVFLCFVIGSERKPFECHDPPKILKTTASMQQVRFPEGVSVHISCTVVSCPKARVTWFHDGHVIQNQTEKHDFTINEGRVADSGMYRCEARNELGTDEKQVLVIVTSCKHKSKSDKDAENAHHGTPRYDETKSSLTELQSNIDVDE